MVVVNLANGANAFLGGGSWLVFGVGSGRRRAGRSRGALARVFGCRMRTNISRCRMVVRTAEPRTACRRRLGTIISACYRLHRDRLRNTITVFGHCFLDSTTGRTSVLLTLSTRYSSYTLSIMRRPPLGNAGVTL